MFSAHMFLGKPRHALPVIRDPAMVKRFLVSSLLIVASITSFAQKVTEIRDTLAPSKTTAIWSGTRETATRLVGKEELQSMVTATGEGDVMKYIQLMPGVATGAEGSSAAFVRGGNIGSNVMTLDGVPLFGASHLLGFATSVPSDILSETSFQVGGFSSEEGNLTASHIRLISGNGNLQERGASVSASNFLIGGTYSGPIKKDTLSFLGSIRISPITPEFAAIRSISSEALDTIRKARALVYDAYGKLTWQRNSKEEISLSAFHTLDSYRFGYGALSEDTFSWNNLIINLIQRRNLSDSLLLTNGISFNRYHSWQGMLKDMSGNVNDLAIVTTVDELTLKTSLNKRLSPTRTVTNGAKLRLGFFNPGTSAEFHGRNLILMPSSPLSDNWLTTATVVLHAQNEIFKPENVQLRVAGRVNVNASMDPNHKWKLRIDPEASILGRYYLTRWLGIEATADLTTQYYHTLEGLPLGWSLDMIIPSDSKFKPERALQGYAGTFMSAGKHSITIGGYYKVMDRLIWFKDASQLFGSVVAGWRDHIIIGGGVSKGIEFLYEKGGDRLTYKIAYTWSKTDRIFPDINGGKPFPAKFDRTHILNANFSWSFFKSDSHEIQWNTFLTYQSGHYNTVPSGLYSAYTLPFTSGGEIGTVEMDYFSSVNNYQMPYYMRIDTGLSIQFLSRAHPQRLNVGIYNVLNRHNPFSVTFDPGSGEWKKISLLPVMPSLSYRIEF